LIAHVFRHVFVAHSNAWRIFMKAGRFLSFAREKQHSFHSFEENERNQKDQSGM